MGAYCEFRRRTCSGGAWIASVDRIDPAWFGAFCRLVAVFRNDKPRTRAAGRGIVSMPRIIEAAMGALRDAFRIFLPEFHVIKVHVVRVNPEVSFPAAIGSVVRVVQIRARFFFHRPACRLDDSKGDGASATLTFGGNRYTPSGVTGGVGHFRVTASAGTEFTASTCYGPGGGSRVYRERYFFPNADTSPGTIRRRCNHSLRSDGAPGAASSARAYFGGGLGTRIGITWTGTVRHRFVPPEFVGAFFLGNLWPCATAFLLASLGLFHKWKQAFGSPTDTSNHAVCRCRR